MNQDQLKQAVADAAVEYVVNKIDADSIIGIGTGSTANCFIDALAVHKHKFAGSIGQIKGQSRVDLLINRNQA